MKAELKIVWINDHKFNSLVNCEHKHFVSDDQGSVCSGCGTFGNSLGQWMMKTNEYTYAALTQDGNMLS